MRTRLLASTLFLSLALSFPCVTLAPAHAELSKTLQREKAGGFTYYPPKGWQLVQKSPSPYKIVIAPMKKGMKFRPNMNFNIVAAPVSLTTFVDGNVQYAQEKMGAKLLSKSSFKSKGGSSGVRVTMATKQLGNNLRQTFYFLTTSSDKKIILTATSLASDGAKHDKDFDDTARSITTS